MINEKLTFQNFGYTSGELLPKSNKLVVAACDICGKVRILKNKDYRDLCQLCSHKTNEFRCKISKTHIDMSGKNNPFYGKHHTNLTKQKISNANTGRYHTNETKRKISTANTGENNSNWGKHHSEENLRKMSESQIGEKNHAWKGGISFGKYCHRFNKTFKILIRKRYHNRCFLCGKSTKENGRELNVHHVNYDKTCLCESNCEFVPLCTSCHGKTNYNRKHWEDVIMNALFPSRFLNKEVII